MNRLYIYSILLFLLLTSFSHILAQVQPEFRTADPKSCDATKSCYYFLKKLPKDKILIGHEDALAYGVKWKNQPGRSDMKDICGSHPAVFGWDVSKIGQSTFNIDTVDFEQMKSWILEAHQLGGINTISWHMDNPVSGGDSWDKTKAVEQILPGGSHHNWLKVKLDTFASFLKDINQRNEMGTAVPILFRPFHEHTGNWFWWGRAHCTTKEYKQLWIFTFEYLTQIKGVHNLLFVYAPDRVKNAESYLERYPGDAYVDILGMDNYSDVGVFGRPGKLRKKLRMVVQLAEAKNKVAALTETGQERLPNRKWWTKIIHRSIFKDPKARQIAYLLVWRNAGPHHFFAPYLGHPSALDFELFTESNQVIMLKDINKLKRNP